MNYFVSEYFDFLAMLKISEVINFLDIFFLFFYFSEFIFLYCFVTALFLFSHVLKNFITSLFNMSPVQHQHVNVSALRSNAIYFSIYNFTLVIFSSTKLLIQ